jgi:hypothetical protein
LRKTATSRRPTRCLELGSLEVRSYTQRNARSRLGAPAFLRRVQVVAWLRTPPVTCVAPLLCCAPLTGYAHAMPIMSTLAQCQHLETVLHANRPSCGAYAWWVE